ncbi:tryptophan 7-halogenase [Aestuariibacter halophilus]|uniref:Tryptophan 7-halogenase n=1 Tax=Fluctibacter halophilus TaxID=226011 RepID=A0ABS8G9S3_9ALTE|nr:tryptophan halogenase family protein [Aestuariibacter halophilus]MCC2617307.1 tryptophan 7-halogenase [Aestuariibacter halophilus]
MKQVPVKHVVIVGGGTAGWMAAASMQRFSSVTPLKVTLVESADIPTVGVGEATIPNFVAFNRNLGLDEIELIRATQATFKLGIQFEDWVSLGEDFFHPFSDYGVPVDGVDFHHYLLHAQRLGEPSALADYSIACALAARGKFAQPHPTPPNPLADYSYAYHLDAGLYANYLRDVAVQRGVDHIQGNVEHVSLRADDGFIDAIELSDGRRISGDLFIDCSGFKGVLIEQALHTGYESWQQWLPCDSALAIQTRTDVAPLPYTRCIARTAGWQWQIPLQHRTGNGYVYASSFESDEQAAATLQAGLQGETITEMKTIRFVPGRRKKIWHKNCFALGLASGFLEPLESTSISLIQTALAKLQTFFPHNGFTPALADEVNRLHGEELERIRDFLILHYALSKRQDSAFWQHCQTMPVPASLQHKIDLYKACGHVLQYANESFEPASWLSMFNGFGVVPDTVDRRALQVPNDKLNGYLAQMRGAIAQAADAAVTHDSFIQRHCRALAD